MEYNTLTDLMTATCDAIREKDGTSENINVQDIPQRILDIPSGGNLVIPQSLSVITEPNINYNIGDVFNPSGLVLALQFSNGETLSIVDGFTYEPTEGLTGDNTVITLSVNLFNTTISCELPIKVQVARYEPIYQYVTKSTGGSDASMDIIDLRTNVITNIPYLNWGNYSFKEFNLSYANASFKWTIKAATSDYIISRKELTNADGNVTTSSDSWRFSEDVNGYVYYVYKDIILS